MVATIALALAYALLVVAIFAVIRREPPQSSPSTDRQDEVSDDAASPAPPKSTIEQPRVLSAAEIEEDLGEHVLGQDEARRKISMVISSRLMGLSLRKSKPPAVLFSGPTGVGKTEMALALAEILTGDRNRVCRIDCSEYGQGHQVSRLTGAPPGYIGFGEESLLERFLRDERGGVLLLDEFEKADRALHRLCLQMLDEGTLTSSNGRRLDLSRFVIIATTNVRRVRKTGVGFANREQKAQKVEPPMKELREVFELELLNRFDSILAFNPIGKAAAKRILRERSIPRLFQNLVPLFEVAGVSISAEVEAQILDLGVSEDFGVRELHRVFEALIIHPFVRLVQELPAGATEGKYVLWFMSEEGVKVRLLDKNSTPRPVELSC